MHISCSSSSLSLPSILLSFIVELLSFGRTFDSVEGGSVCASFVLNRLFVYNDSFSSNLEHVSASAR